MPFALDEDSARRLLLLQAVESAPEGPLWTAEDRRWASRAATQALGDDAPAGPFLVERARLAMQRLAPRDAALRQVLERPLWRPAWLPATLIAGLLLGLMSDALLAGPYFNLLSPVFFGLLGWNLAVFALLAVTALRARPAGVAPGLARWVVVQALARWLRRAGRGAGTALPLADFAARWSRAARPLTTTRAAWLLHAGAAALVLGTVAGMYARALVFDYRAGWATTLLEPAQVHALLAALFAPAQALSGIAVPDGAGIAALRVTPEQAASASAAGWIHLIGLTLALGVALPRVALALWAARRARRLASDLALPLDTPYFQRLQARAAAPARQIAVLTHGQTASAATVQGLTALLARALGASAPPQFAPALPYGDEDAAGEAARGLAGGPLIVLLDLAATPEPEVHGLLLQSLPGQPVLVLDASAFVCRFGTGQRLAERSAAWRAMLAPLRVPLVIADLAAADQPEAEAELRAALEP